MAHTQPHPAPVKDEPKAKKTTKHKIDPQAEPLVEELSNYYGVEFTGDEDKFIEECYDKRDYMAKHEQDGDQPEQQRYDGKLGELRKIWPIEDKVTAEQKALKKQIKDEYPGVSITFPDDKSWVINAYGKEDSGHMSADPAHLIEKLKAEREQ